MRRPAPKPAFFDVLTDWRLIPPDQINMTSAPKVKLLLDLGWRKERKLRDIAQNAKNHQRDNKQDEENELKLTYGYSLAPNISDLITRKDTDQEGKRDEYQRVIPEGLIEIEVGKRDKHSSRSAARAIQTG